MLTQSPIQKRTTSAIRQAIRMFMVGEDGAVLVEFTVFVSLLCIASVYVADFGLYFNAQARVQNAAQAGAQYAIVNASAPLFTSINGITISSSQNYYCPSSLSTPVAQSSTCSDGSEAGKYITVLATQSYKPLVRYGLFPNATYTLTGSATVRAQ